MRIRRTLSGGAPSDLIDTSAGSQAAVAVIEDGDICYHLTNGIQLQVSDARN